MKLWMKYLIGIALGLILSFALPVESAGDDKLLTFLVNLVIRFGRYIILPLLFFSVTSAVIKLREQKKVLKTSIWIVSTIVASTIVLVAIGLLSALIIKLPPIPISVKKANDIPVLTISELFTKLFPLSGFQTLTEGAYLLPAFVFAALAGIGCSNSRDETKTAITLFEALSKACYNILKIFTEILSVGLIAIMCRQILNFIPLWKSGIYNSLLLRLFIDLLLILFAVYPLITRFLCHGAKVMRIVYVCIAPFFAAFLTGDSNLALGVNLRHGRESLCIEDSTANFSFPLFSIFARGGAALVQSIGFVLILISYSELGISLVNALWISGVSFLLSFALAQLPVGGPFFAITIMCGMFGRGFEAGYLLLKDVAPLLGAFAAGIDAITAIFASYIIAAKTGTLHHQETSKFL